MGLLLVATLAACGSTSGNGVGASDDSQMAYDPQVDKGILRARSQSGSGPYILYSGRHDFDSNEEWFAWVEIGGNSPLPRSTGGPFTYHFSRLEAECADKAEFIAKVKDAVMNDGDVPSGTAVKFIETRHYHPDPDGQQALAHGGVPAGDRRTLFEHGVYTVMRKDGGSWPRAGWVWSVKDEASGDQRFDHRDVWALERPGYTGFWFPIDRHAAIKIEYQGDSWVNTAKNKTNHLNPWEGGQFRFKNWLTTQHASTTRAGGIYQLQDMRGDLEDTWTKP